MAGIHLRLCCEATKQRSRTANGMLPQQETPTDITRAKGGYRLKRSGLNSGRGSRAGLSGLR